MDYEVFLVSRIREAYHATGDNAESVARGLAATGRVITSGALIMVCVFLGFVTDPSPFVKMIGLGLATAIAIDATVVRMVLVPATMALHGPGQLVAARMARPAAAAPQPRERRGAVQHRVGACPGRRGAHPCLRPEPSDDSDNRSAGQAGGPDGPHQEDRARGGDPLPGQLCARSRASCSSPS